MDINKVIEILEQKVSSLISNEEIRPTQVASLVMTLLKLYEYRDKEKQDG